jgi:hypothetical protein
MKYNCNIRSYSKSSKPKLDSQLDFQQSTSVMSVRSMRKYTPSAPNNLIYNLIATSNFSEKRNQPNTPNLIPNLIATSNFSEIGQHCLTYPNLIPNLIATINFSETDQTYHIYYNLI